MALLRFPVQIREREREKEDVTVDGDRGKPLDCAYHGTDSAALSIRFAAGLVAGGDEAPLDGGEGDLTVKPTKG